ncbi:MAG: M23 family metallopeptidase [Sphingomonadaceae bacterium]|nr:M23 family metallopeptidase [Sphingomonadaceae bacterium]
MGRCGSSHFASDRSLLIGLGLIAVCAGAFAVDSASSVAGSSQRWPPAGLAIPVDHVESSALRDTFGDGRPGHRHEAIDIAAPRGTKVLAVDDGEIVKLFTSVRGGLTVYQFDPQGRLAYYYAHLDRYAETVHEGMTVHRCDLIGYVGSTGNAPADAPHLHFATFLLGARKHWWEGTAINPFPALRGSCD